MKLCFNIWYPIVVENQTFIKICDYIDCHNWLSMLIMLLFYIANINIVFLTNIGQKRYAKWYIFILIIGIAVGIFFLKKLNNVFGNIVEIVFLLVVAILYNI